MIVVFKHVLTSIDFTERCGEHPLLIRFAIFKKFRNLITKNMQPNNPLHGVKLNDMLLFLEQKYGWEELGKRINIRCFQSDPSIKSSLKFLRRTPWARTKVEALYLESLKN